MRKLLLIICLVSFAGLLVLFAYIGLHGATGDRITLAGDLGKVCGGSFGFWAVLTWQARRKARRQRTMPTGEESHEERSEADTTDAPYGSLIAALVIFTLVASTFIFIFASATAQGSRDAFSTIPGTFLVLLIAVTYLVKRCWSKIELAEPVANPIFVRKHRAFAWKAGSVMTVAGLLAGCYGVFLGLHRAKINTLMSQMRTLSVKGAPIKQRFIEVSRRNTPTVPEYLQRCKELGPINDEYEATLQKMDDLLVLLQTELGSDDAYTETAATVKALAEKDLEGARIFRQELTAAKQLAMLPSEQAQLQFYDAQIKPITIEEDRVAREETEILKKARAKGIKLSEKLYKDAGLQ